MKNKLLLGAFLFASVGVSTAQRALLNEKGLNLDAKAPSSSVLPKALGTTVWHDDFNNIHSGTPLAVEGPSSWTANNDGQTGSAFGWTTDDVFDGWAFTTFASSSGGNFAEVSNGVPTPAPGTQALGVNYTLTSGVIDVQSLAGGAGVLLSFEQRGAKFYDSTYVQVSTNGTVWTTVYSNSHKPMHTNTSSNPWPNPELVEVDIESAIQSGASTVQIRFGWTSDFPSDMDPAAWITYGWLIDDVKITTKPDYDLVYTYGDHHIIGYQYSQIPLTQVAPILFRAGVRNQGTEGLTGVKYVITDGTVTEESNTISLAAGAVDTLEATFTPSSLGAHTITGSLTMTETDDNPSNNTNIPNVAFTVTQNTYAVDKGAPFTQFPLTSLSVGGTPVVIEAVGTSYDIFADQEIRGIDFRFFTGTQVGATVYGELYEWNESATDIQDVWSYVTETDFFEVTSMSQVNSIHTLQFLSPYMLEAGKTYLILLQLATGTIQIAVGGSSDTGQGWLKSDHSNVWGTFTAIPVVRMNFDPTLAVDNNEFVSGVSVFPNPASEKATVEFNLANSSDVTVEVTDITGKIVQTVAMNNVAVGANSTELNVTGFAAGLYSVVIKSNDSSVTRKLVIQ